MVVAVRTTHGGMLGALSRAVSRDEFFAGLYFLGCVNGLFGRVLLAVKSQGLAGMLAVDVSVIVLFACFTGISLLWQAERRSLQVADLLVGCVFLILTTLPMFALSWVAVTGLSFYILVFADDGNRRRRASLILLALSVSMLWSRLLFQFFTGPILEFDSTFVATFLGTPRTGNLIDFADGSGTMILLPECSSFMNVSLAFLSMVTITQWAGHRWSAVDIFWLLFACAAIVATNVARIALTGVSYANYELIHSPWGSTIFGMVILMLTIGISVLSARREIFVRS